MFVAALLAMLSCGSGDNALAEVTEVDSSAWNTPVELTFCVTDTLSRFDMNLLARHESYVSTDDVELRVSTTAPNGVMWNDDFTLHLSPAKRATAVSESAFRRNIRWNQIGEYKLTLYPQHLYRGVLAVGVNIIEQE